MTLFLRMGFAVMIAGVVSNGARAEAEQVAITARFVTHETSDGERKAQREQGLPVLLRYGKPVYPKELNAMGAQGCAAVAFDVRPDGMTDEFEILKSWPPGIFDQLAVQSVLRMEFEPRAETVRARRTFVFHFDQNVGTSKLDRNPDWAENLSERCEENQEEKP